MEVAFDADDADRQKTLAAVAHLGRRAIVDDDRAAQLQVVAHPLLARSHLGRGREQGRADALAGGQAKQHVRLAPGGDDGAGAAARRALGGENLGQHAAAPDRRARAARHPLELRVAGVGLRDQAGTRIDTRIGGEKARLVGEDHQRIGVEQVGDERGQSVVVAELDLVVDDRVVLVDHRHDAEAEQRHQRRTRVEVALAVGEVGVRQQHLRAADAVRAQRRLVDLRQAHLSDRSRRLELVDGARPRRPSEPLHPFGDGAARDHDELALLAHELGHLPAPAADRIGVDATAVVGDEARSDLDDDPARPAHDLAHRAASVPGVSKRGSGSTGAGFACAATWS